jgi:TfoX/Sxy family transcriptional regulator of competence genes
MAYDEELAERVRGLLPDVPVAERRMFGGLAFLVGGHLAVAVSGQGGLMVRCDPADSERLLAEPGATRMVMHGREMDGWLRVGADALPDDEVIGRWVGVGTTYAAGLPPKG